MKKRTNRNAKRGKQFTGKMQKKLIWTFGMLLAALVALNARLLFINATHGDAYTKKVLSQKGYASTTIPARRGTIYDINGERLATSEKVYYVILDCKMMNELKPAQLKATIDALTTCFPELTEEKIKEYLEERATSAYVRALKEIPYDQVQIFLERQEAASEDNDIMDIKGVWFEETYIRVYPYNHLASHVIGFTESDTYGRWGIEEYYNDVLTGTDGRTYGYLNDDSNVETTTQAAVDGHSVVATIDAGIQRIVEDKVTAFNEEHRNEARAGLGSKNTAVIVMNPKTGAILAECVYPYYNLNDPQDMTYLKDYTEADVEEMKAVDEEHARILEQNPEATFEDDERVGFMEAVNDRWRNFCISDTYEPGSTYKPFTVASGLEMGVLNGTESFYCDGYEVVSGVRVKCSHNSGHGPLTLEQSVMKSCNDALMQISYKVGTGAFTDFQEVFGFGKKTGVDLPGEVNAAGLLYTADTMNELDLAVNSFGQNFNVTMTQMMSAYCSLINDGKYYKPHVVQRIIDEDGEVVSETQPVLLKKTVSEETSAKLRQYMYQTVEAGTSTSARVSGYTVGGKTGTAEKFPRGQGNYLVSFISFAPADDPELAFYVVIDEPNTESQANSRYAVVLSQQIMAEVLPYYGVEKSEDAEPEALTNEEAIDIWAIEPDEPWDDSFIEDPDTNHFEENKHYEEDESDYWETGETGASEGSTENYE